MSRDKEIEKASVEYQMSKKPMALGGDAFADIVYNMNINPSFIAGAKWADKTMIEKACEWLNNFYSEDRYAYLVKEDIDAFKQAMED